MTPQMHTTNFLILARDFCLCISIVPVQYTNRSPHTYRTSQFVDHGISQSLNKQLPSFPPCLFHLSSSERLSTHVSLHMLYPGTLFLYAAKIAACGSSFFQHYELANESFKGYAYNPIAQCSILKWHWFTIDGMKAIYSNATCAYRLQTR